MTIALIILLSILGFALTTFLAFYLLWAQYLLVMNLKRVRDAGLMTDTAYKLGLPLLGIGYAWDIFCNLTFSTIIFLDIPREWVVTARLSRYIYREGYRGRLARYRGNLAQWFCSNLLDAYDPTGCHCKK